MSQPEILIVGAGPVGLTMAAALDHWGHRPRIIDKASMPSDKSKALVVWSRTLELLDGLRLADDFVAAGHRIAGGSIYSGGERLVHLALTSDESPFGFPLMIPQNETERLLTEHLARRGIAVERSVELIDFQDVSQEVVGKVRHADGREEAFNTPWLIGCDGAHSAVRHGLGMDFTGEAEPNDWLLADVHVAGSVTTDEISVYWHDRGVLVLFPITRDRFRIIADIGSAAGAPSRTVPTLADAQARVDERGPGGLRLSDPVWLANFRINERKVADYRRGRVILAGDAAHIHSPAGGQGMNTGMQDAFNLSWKLALVHEGRGQAEPLLGSYSIERSAVGDQVLRNAGRFTTIATLRNPVGQWLRNHIAPIVSSFDFVQDKIRREWQELSIDYRHSPLSQNHCPSHVGGLQAGDRLCDAELTSIIDGRSTTLFKETSGHGHALLLLPADGGSDAINQMLTIGSEAAREYAGLLTTYVILPANGTASPPDTQKPKSCVWRDTQSTLHDKLYATAPTLILVRPDGYIGLRCQPANSELVRAYLADYLQAVPLTN